jgi:hypothetical protein
MLEMINARTLLLSAACLFTACSGLSDDIKRRCGEEERAFLRMPVNAREIEFRKLDVERQYQLYLCESQIPKPPTKYLIEPLAEQGAALIPILRNELNATHDDLIVRDVVALLLEINRSGTYDVAADASLVQLARSRVEGMDDEFWKDFTAKMLDELIA